MNDFYSLLKSKLNNHKRTLLMTLPFSVACHNKNDPLNYMIFREEAIEFIYNEIIGEPIPRILVTEPFPEFDTAFYAIMNEAFVMSPTVSKERVKRNNALTRLNGSDRLTATRILLSKLDYASSEIEKGLLVLNGLDNVFGNPELRALMRVISDREYVAEWMEAELPVTAAQYSAVTRGRHNLLITIDTMTPKF